MAINNFLSFRGVRVVVKAVDFLFRARWVEFETELKLFCSFFDIGIVLIREANNSEDLVLLVRASHANMDLVGC